ncbi:MAG: pyridoxal-phosphate dependent enzyme, partial [Actinobacteria bacterium]|nr:pyridoxal-phosphate dependent enzyme [Actinomycetota bacterium]
MEIHDSVLDLIGNTPLVNLKQVAKDKPCKVVVKAEMTNPGGSSKDRPAVSMIDHAEREGLLKPGGTIVEPTSGNTGVGLAIVAAQRGYKCVFVMTDKVAPEKVDLLRAYGAEVVVCPVAVAPDDPQSYYSTAERLVNEIPGAYRPNQYFNPTNPLAHYESTGPEIWRQTDGTVTHFVAGGGTGGTLSGVSRYLKEQNPAIQVICADPEGSVYSGGSGRPYLVEGVGEDFWPTTYHPDLIDRVIPISDADSFAMARRVSQEEGLLIGGSCGTAVAAALQVADECTPDDLIVVLTPDSGRGYLSKVFNDDWMGGFGFLRADGPVVSDIIDRRNTDVPELLYVQPHHKVSEAVA